MKITPPPGGGIITYLLVVGEYDETIILGAMSAYPEEAERAAWLLTAQRARDMSTPRDLIVVRVERTATLRPDGKYEG